MITRLIGATLFIVSSPLAFIIGTAIFLTDGWPVLYRQWRIGLGGKPFMLYKFRTMVRGAEKLKRKYLGQNESEGPTFKIREDPRFTRVGRFLSHTGLDELPQFINVTRGEMAFIGPRPFPVPEEKKLLSWMKEREVVLPGIISPAILTGRHHGDFTGWMKSDVIYARKKSLATDAVIIFRLVPFFLGLFLRELRTR